MLVAVSLSNQQEYLSYQSIPSILQHIVSAQVLLCVFFAASNAFFNSALVFGVLRGLVAIFSPLLTQLVNLYFQMHRSNAEIQLLLF